MLLYYKIKQHYLQYILEHKNNKVEINIKVNSY